MGEDQSDDDEALLARLNAIRKSNVTLHFSNPPPTQPSPSVDALTARFQSLHPSFSSRPANPLCQTFLSVHDDSPPSPTIEELIAQIDPEERFSLHDSDLADARTLLSEAKSALPPENPTPQIDRKEAAARAETYCGDDTPEDESDDENKIEDEEAAASLQHILNEIDSPQPQDPTTSHPHPILPSPPKISLRPSTLPKPPILPSTPTTTLLLPQVTIPPPYTDAQIDSWCAICCADAAVRCRGCAGELYCVMCWREGHVGPEVGREQRGHSWEKWGRGKGVGDFDG